jgi:hypothetical protein
LDIDKDPKVLAFLDALALSGQVTPGELHGGPRFLHHRAHPDPLRTVDRGGSG